MFNKKNFVKLSLAATIFVASVVPSNAIGTYRPGNLVTIWGDRGGEVISYALKANRYQKSGKSLKFAGKCDSACTIYLSMPRNKMCLEQTASFGFHLPYGASVRGNRTAASYLMRKYPSWVRSWIQANGGLTNSIKRMDYQYASRFIASCNTNKSQFANI